MTPKEERDMHAQAWDAWDAARAPAPASPEDAAKADFIREGGPDNLMAAYGADRGPVFDPEPESPAGAPAPALSPRALSVIRGRRGSMPTPSRVARAAAPTPEAFNGNVRPGSDMPPIPDAPPAAGAGGGGDTPPAPAQAPEQQGGLGYFSVLSRLNDQFAPHQLGKKPDYTNTNAIDAMDKAQRAAPDALLRGALLKARLAKATAPAAPHTNDALETAKFNKQWELDHPKDPADKKPGMSQAQVDELFKARLAKLRAGGGGRGGGVDSDAVDLGARLLLSTGAMPSIGSGGTDLRSAILARAHQIDPEAAKHIAQASATYGGEKHAVGQQIGREASVETSTGALDNTLNTVVKNAEGVTRSNIPAIDRFLVPLEAGGGSINAQNLGEAVKTAQAEYARLLSMGPNGNGQPFAENMKRAEQVIHVGMTPEQLKAAATQIRSLNAGINNAATKVGAEHLGRMGGDPSTTPSTASATPPAGAQDGTRWTNLNGTTYERVNGGWKKVANGGS